MTEGYQDPKVLGRETCQQCQGSGYSDTEIICTLCHGGGVALVFEVVESGLSAEQEHA